jgi:hypothetical protein
MICIRITREFENKMTVIQAQITAEFDQNLSCMEIKIQKVKKAISKSLNIGFERLLVVITKSNNENLFNEMNVIKNFIVENEVDLSNQNENILNTIMDNLKKLGFLIQNEFKHAEEINKVILLTVDENIKIVCPNVGYGIEMIKKSNEEISLLLTANDDNKRNFREVCMKFDEMVK